MVQESALSVDKVIIWLENVLLPMKNTCEIIQDHATSVDRLAINLGSAQLMVDNQIKTKALVVEVEVAVVQEVQEFASSVVMQVTCLENALLQMKST